MGSINESNKKIKESKKNKPRLCYKNIKSKLNINLFFIINLLYFEKNYALFKKE